MQLPFFIFGTALLQIVLAGYNLEDDYSVDFFDKFDFIAGLDSTTGGYTNYLSRADAQSAGLINTNNNQIFMGVDDTNVAQAPGRKSLRLESKKIYNHGLIILDLEHMPGGGAFGGCGQWPAFWTYGPESWPENGEIDILEGIGDVEQNTMTLHTSAGCAVDPQYRFTVGSNSTTLTPNCDVKAPGQAANQGCSNRANHTSTYGNAFNGEGGIYATEWTSHFIAIWFWANGTEPSDIHDLNPNPGAWGTPTTIFQGQCEMDKSFQNHKLVFDLTFCGADQPWSSSCAAQTHASTCQAFVQNTPSAFKEAYWSVRSLKVYQEEEDKTC